ncbi:hypothetical protein LSAT2_027803 [Lamellibrachia satsuma]|nr:hypothetical protein LSAT2_027803 [Lamellibrachia satsuma]
MTGTSYAARALRYHGVANYSLDARLVEEGDEIYLRVWQPSGDDSDIADRLRKNTYSWGAKNVPLKAPARPSTSIVPIIANPVPAFQQVPEEKVDEIVNRLTKTMTVAVKARYAQETEESVSPKRPMCRKTAKGGPGILRSSRQTSQDDKAVRFRDTPQPPHTPKQKRR